MKLLLLAILFQPLDTIPSIEQLYACIEEYHAQTLDAELAEHEETTKGEWLKYVPSVGLTYTINNKPRPSVSFSTSTIYQARKGKQLRAAKRSAIRKANSLNLSGHKSNIKALVQKYQKELESLELSYQIHDIDSKLYQIEEAKHENIKIAPSEFLKIQRAYLLKQFDLKQQERAVDAIREEILLLSRC